MDSGIEFFEDDSQWRSMTASRDHEAVPPVRRKTGLDKLLEDFGIRPVPEVSYGGAVVLRCSVVPLS